MNLTDIHRTFCPTAAEYTFLSNRHGTFSRIDYTRSQIVLAAGCWQLMPVILTTHEAEIRRITI
jgi:hypothetical protein